MTSLQLVTASDLSTINLGNQLFKFADCAYLPILSSNSLTCESEIKHIKEWALSNNLGQNQSKSMEMVITAPGSRGTQVRAHPPSPVHAIVCRQMNTSQLPSQRARNRSTLRVVCQLQLFSACSMQQC
jgi:hypothetical protein